MQNNFNYCYHSSLWVCCMYQEDRMHAAHRVKWELISDHILLTFLAASTVVGLSTCASLVTKTLFNHSRHSRHKGRVFITWFVCPVSCKILTYRIGKEQRNMTLHVEVLLFWCWNWCWIHLTSGIPSHYPMKFKCWYGKAWICVVAIQSRRGRILCQLYILSLSYNL